MFSLIVAYDDKHVIGKDGILCWDIKEDLQLFKDKTLNHTIVMGKTTFDGIGRVLPKRNNIIVTRKNILIENAVVINDLEKYLIENENSEEEIFICGGKSIYLQALPYCHKLCISHINGEHDGDTTLELDLSAFEVVNEIKFNDFIYREYNRR
ncbi:MAG: dihydrofolate reductase [Erysipelotrichaceae bacterium]